MYRTYVLPYLTKLRPTEIGGLLRKIIIMTLEVGTAT